MVINGRWFVMWSRARKTGIGFWESASFRSAPPHDINYLFYKPWTWTKFEISKKWVELDWIRFYYFCCIASVHHTFFIQIPQPNKDLAIVIHALHKLFSGGDCTAKVKEDHKSDQTVSIDHGIHFLQFHSNSNPICKPRYHSCFRFFLKCPWNSNFK